MMRSRLPLALLAAVVLLAGSAVPSARAANPQLLRAIVVQIAQGKFDACDYSPAQLQTALSSIPPDFDEYAPQVRTAIEDALNNRDCTKPKPKGGGTGSPNPGGGSAGGGSPGGGTVVPPPTGRTRPDRARPHEKTQSPAASPRATATPDPPAAKSVSPVPVPAAAAAGEGGGTPGVLLVLAVLGGLGALGALLVAASRGLGWEPRWAPAMRHAWAEAGHRSGGTWGDFRDWLRLGR